MNLEVPDTKQKHPDPDLPWFVPGAIEALHALITSGQVRRVLEYGSGGSSVFVATHGANVVSIEHDARWAARTRAALAQRGLPGQVKMAPPDANPQDPMYRGRDKRSYRQYVKAGTAAAREHFGCQIDCVIVDGRARVACVKVALRYVRPGGILVLDDAERESYAPAEERLIALGWARRRYTWQRHITDFWQAPPEPAARQSVLVLSSDRPGGRLNDLLHRGFFDACPWPLHWYGPGERGPVNFRPGQPLREVVRTTRATLVLVNMRSRVQGWLQPEALATLDVPTAMIDVDYCYSARAKGDPPDLYRGDDTWFRRAEFDRVFLRHKIDTERSQLRNCEWLPFSNDPQVFKPGAPPDIDVGFAGSLQPEALYATRRAAVAALKGYIEVRERTLTGLAFAQFLARCRIALTCGGAFHYDLAKHVQIPATGALLATSGSEGAPDLLPDADMYIRYTLDNVATRVRDVLADEAQRAERAEKARRHCRTHHTHGHRWRALLAAINGQKVAGDVQN